MLRYVIPLANKYGYYKVVLSTNLKRGRAHLFYEALNIVRHERRFFCQCLTLRPSGMRLYVAD